MSRHASIPRGGTGLVVLAALFLGSCGSGATEGPDDDREAARPQPQDEGAHEREGGGGSGGGDRYSWNLPVGDVSPDDSTILYYELRRSCDAGEAAVTGDAASRYPSELLQLYRAAIAVCRGDVQGGRELYRGAGTAGYATGCLIREAILSVLEQRPQDISACPYRRIDEQTTTSEGDATTSSSEAEETTTTTTAAGGDEATTGSGGDGSDGA